MKKFPATFIIHGYRNDVKKISDALCLQLGKTNLNPRKNESNASNAVNVVTTDSATCADRMLILVDSNDFDAKAEVGALLELKIWFAHRLRMIHLGGGSNSINDVDASSLVQCECHLGMDLLGREVDRRLSDRDIDILIRRLATNCSIVTESAWKMIGSPW